MEPRFRIISGPVQHPYSSCFSVRLDIDSALLNSSSNGQAKKLMVLTDESTLVSRLIAAWNARSEELRERIAMDPANDASWLWAIQLRICTYLLRRYGREQKSDTSPELDAKDSVTVIHPRKTFNATRPPHSYDENVHRARFRHRCQETLVRLQSLVADARTRSLQRADSEVKLAHERRCRARRRQPGLQTLDKAVAVVAIFLIALLTLIMVLLTLQ